MAYCGHCGAEVAEGDAFCRACGTPVTVAAPIAGPPAESSRRRTGRIALIVVAVVLGLLVLGGVVYVAAILPIYSRVQQVSSTASSTGTTGGAGSGIATAASGGSSSSTAGSVTTTAPTSGAGENPVTPTKPKSTLTANDVTHQATFVTKTGVADGGAHTITFDYVQFLTGTAATKAAVAHGDTAENDYYVVNDNPKLRTFPVSSAVVIKLHPANGPSYSRIFTFSAFKALISAHSATYGGKTYDWSSETTYYITVKNGKVARIEQQWVP